MIREPCKNIEEKHVNKSKKSVQHITYEIKYGSSLLLVTSKIQVLLEKNESKIKKYKKKIGFIVTLSIKKYQRKLTGLFIFFDRNVKVSTFCKIILYWLSFRFFPIIFLDLLSTLAIVIELDFITCLYLLKSFFFNFETVVLHQAIFP